MDGRVVELRSQWRTSFAFVLTCRDTEAGRYVCMYMYVYRQPPNRQQQPANNQAASKHQSNGPTSDLFLYLSLFPSFHIILTTLVRRLANVAQNTAHLYYLHVAYLDPFHWLCLPLEYAIAMVNANQNTLSNFLPCIRTVGRHSRSHRCQSASGNKKPLQEKN